MCKLFVACHWHNDYMLVKLSFFIWPIYVIHNTQPFRNIWPIFFVCVCLCRFWFKVELPFSSVDGFNVIYVLLSVNVFTILFSFVSASDPLLQSLFEQQILYYIWNAINKTHPKVYISYWVLYQKILTSLSTNQYSSIPILWILCTYISK